MSSAWLSGVLLVATLVLLRVLGLAAAALLGATAARIFASEAVTPLSSPLPFYAYPVLVATLGGRIWTLLREAEVTRAD